MVNNYKILKHVYKDTVRFEQLYNQNKSDTIIDVEIRVNWKCNARCAMCGLENYIENCNEERKTEMSYSQIVSRCNIFWRRTNIKKRYGSNY